MPWDMNDYPSSLKNMNDIVRKKAIDIANAMVDEGYDESRAIPIATKQAESWYKHADKDEVNAFANQVDPTERDDTGDQYENRPEMLDKDEHVVRHENGWAVQSKDAKKASNVFDTKEEAVKRGKEIAHNKGTGLTVHKHDGTIQEYKSYK